MSWQEVCSRSIFRGWNVGGIARVGTLVQSVFGQTGQERALHRTSKYSARHEHRVKAPVVIISHLEDRHANQTVVAEAIRYPQHVGAPVWSRQQGRNLFLRTTNRSEIELVGLV